MLPSVCMRAAQPCAFSSPVFKIQNIPVSTGIFHKGIVPLKHVWIHDKFASSSSSYMYP